MKSIVVVGNARSGTSMTSALLSILGVRMHKTKLNTESQKVIAQNPKGAYENADFINLTSDMHRDYRNGDSEEKIINKYNRRIKETVFQYELSPMWGFKSALTAPFLPMFIKHLQNPYIVCVTRNLLHNAQSWVVQMKDVYGEKITIDYALDVMSEQQHMMFEKLKETSCPKHYTTYEGIKNGPELEIEKMAEFLKVPITEKAKLESKEFIMPEYSTLNNS